MVLKGTKRSFRTGNTLRNVGDVQTNKRTRSFIVRHATDLSRRQRSDTADDSFLTADGVEFSMNKKGRWNLPDVIETSIKRGDCRDDGSLRVSMFRRHLANRQSDCVNIIASHPAAVDDDDDDAERCEVYSATRRKKARRKTYCNGLNVLHSGRGKSTKDSRKKQVVSTKQDIAQRRGRSTAASDAPLENAGESDPKPATPQVQYDVFYPIPTSSSLRFHPKFAAGAAPRDGIEQQLVATAGLKPGKGSHHRHKYVDDYDDVYDEGEDDDFYDDWDYYGEGCGGDEHDWSYREQGRVDQYGDLHTDVCRDGAVVLFSDVVEHAVGVAALSCSTASAGDDCGFPTRKARRAKAKAAGKKKRKNGRCYYHFYRPERVGGDADSCLEEDSRSDYSTESGETAVPASSQPPSPWIPTEVASVVVRLPREATSRSALAGLYGPRYTEAACFPRKIVIDITDRVHNALKRAASFRDLYLPSVDLTSYATYSHSRGQFHQHRRGIFYDGEFSAERLSRRRVPHAAQHELPGSRDRRQDAPRPQREL